MLKQDDNTISNTRCGFAAIIGKPNVGKSTLLNALIGEKVAIVSPKPNTTRNKIAGIVTKGDSQAIFLDTPGIHNAKEGLNLRMVKTAVAAISEVDVVLLMVEAGTRTDEIEKDIARKTQNVAAKRFLVINKIDRVSKSELLPEIETRLKEMGSFDEVIPISALKKDGVDRVKKAVMQYLPNGPHYYPGDIFTDQPERAIAAEMIREQVFNLTKEEVPYATAITIEEWDEKPERVLIRARIHVETSGQKAIIIGKGGAMIKNIGVNSRQQIENMLAAKVYLELFADVISKWRRDDRMLDELGYQDVKK